MTDFLYRHVRNVQEKKCHHITPVYRFSASIITIFLGLEPCSKKFSSGLCEKPNFLHRLFFPIFSEKCKYS